jgi:hypothetical protein
MVTRHDREQSVGMPSSAKGERRSATKAQEKRRLSEIHRSPGKIVHNAPQRPKERRKSGERAEKERRRSGEEPAKPQG